MPIHCRPPPTCLAGSLLAFIWTISTNCHCKISPVLFCQSSMLLLMSRNIVLCSLIHECRREDSYQLSQYRYFLCISYCFYVLLHHQMNRFRLSRQPFSERVMFYFLFFRSVIICFGVLVEIPFNSCCGPA